MIDVVLGVFCLGVLFPAYMAFMAWQLVQCVKDHRQLRSTANCEKRQED